LGWRGRVVIFDVWKTGDDTIDRSSSAIGAVLRVSLHLQQISGKIKEWCGSVFENEVWSSACGGQTRERLKGRDSNDSTLARVI